MPAQKLTIEIQAIGIVNIGRFEEAQQARLGGRDDTAQLRVRESVIAYEIDAQNLRFRPFGDFKNDIQTAIIKFDDLNIGLDGIVTGPAIDIENALHVRLRLGSCKDGPGTKLHLRGKRLVLNVAVTLKDDLIDDRVLVDDLNGHDTATPGDIDILEKARRNQRLDTFARLESAIAITNAKCQITADCFWRYTLRAGNPDFANNGTRLRISCAAVTNMIRNYG